MKNGSTETLEAKIAERNERAKKLYRYISDLARRVGEMTTKCQSIKDLFSMHIEIQRQKLRDNCEKLLFLDPLNYGKKTLELLWRKVYYDTVSAAKKLQEVDAENNGYLFTHIVCGIGNFHHFVSRIQIDLKVSYKEVDYVSDYNDEENLDIGTIPTEEDVQFGKSALYTCLIYLGDLNRYQVEIFHNIDSSTAARYYLQAAHIDLSSGMPYNQLANLYLDKNYNLDSACYYIHCLNCASPFDGTMDNLKKIFEKNDQYCEIDPESMSQIEHIQNTIVKFLSLIEIWYLGKNDTNIPQRCSTIAQGLKLSMDFTKIPLPDINKSKHEDYLQALEDENITPSYLNNNLVHKIVQICLFTIPKMVESDETKAFACKAFTLALYSQILQKLSKNLEQIGLKNPARKYRERTLSIQEAEVKITENHESVETETAPIIDTTRHINGNSVPEEEEVETKENSDKEEIDNTPNEDTKNNNKKLLKRRRRRRVASSGSSDISDVDSVSESEDVESSSEQESESTFQSGDESQSEQSFDETDEEEEHPSQNGIHEKPMDDLEVSTVSNGNITATENNDTNKDTNLKNNELNEKELKNFLLGDNVLASMKLLQDWILTEKDLILSCGESGDSLFQCVVDLLNILSHYFIHKFEKIEEKDSQILVYARSIVKLLKLEYKNIPLPEDVNLRGTNICKFDKNAAEWQILDHRNISVYEENIIRILNFIDFGNNIAKIVPRIRYNRTMKIFYLKKIAPPKVNTKINHKRSREWHNSKKLQIEPPDSGLLRRLGRLWLTSQVRELERSGRQPATPALLALDTAVLHKHLRRVKQLLRAKNFILLIPAVVLQELDTLKREQSSARDAIRWLELQLKSGSRFLRAQRPGQSKPLPLLKYPRKAPPHIHNFIQILEFCNHFVGEDKQQGGKGDSDNSLPNKPTQLLILLKGDQSGSDDEQYKEFSVTGAAKSAGISVEYIEDFYSKWRQSVHKSNKKR